MKKRVTLLIILFLIPLAMASFDLKNSSIDQFYSPGESIKGEINISFEDLSNSTIYAGDFEGGTTLINFLESNGYECQYSDKCNCFPNNCEEYYVPEDGESSKSFHLGLNEEKVMTFKVQGKVNGITGLSFDLNVENQESCISPLEIDILDNNNTEWESNKFNEDYSCTYEGGMGCFEGGEEEVKIGSTPYCEKVKLVESGKFELGAWVKKDGEENENLKMVLYNLNGEELTSCNLPSPTESGGEISCNTEYYNSEIKEYYVCIRAEEKSITNYVTKKEDSNPCGFYGIPGEETEYHDYYIFGKGAKFDSIGKIKFNQDLYDSGSGNSLANYIDNYILDKFDRNCSDGCSIPLKLKSNYNSDIIIDNISLSYDTGGGPRVSGEIYNSKIGNAKVKTDYLNLDLKYSNILTPNEYGNYSLELFLNEEEILGEEISTLTVPEIISVSPTIVPAGISNNFKVKVNIYENKSVINYIWDFQDEIKNTTNNEASYTFSSLGEKSLEVSVIDEEGLKNSKTFLINVVSPKNAVNSTIKNYKEKLDNISSKLNNLEGWKKKVIGGKMDVDELSKEVERWERKYNTKSDSYINIIRNLTELDIPYYLGESNIGSQEYFVDYQEITPSLISDLGGGDYNNERKEIVGWMDENLDLKLEFEVISAYYDDKTEDLATFFKLNIKPKEQSDNDLFLVIEENVKINTLTAKDLDSGIGIRFDSTNNKDVEFSIGERKEKVVLYLAPKFSKLETADIGVCNYNGKCEPEIGENKDNCGDDCKPWGTASFLIILVVFLGLAAYIALQWWYKRNYENHLFKNRNDIYNLVNFVKNARGQNLTNSKIKKNLRKSGWSGEQINYVFKKIKGNAIMPFDFIKLFKGFKKSGE